MFQISKSELATEEIFINIRKTVENCKKLAKICANQSKIGKKIQKAVVGSKSLAAGDPKIRLWAPIEEENGRKRGGSGMSRCLKMFCFWCWSSY